MFVHFRFAVCYKARNVWGKKKKKKKKKIYIYISLFHYFLKFSTPLFLLVLIPSHRLMVLWIRLELHNINVVLQLWLLHKFIISLCYSGSGLFGPNRTFAMLMARTVFEMFCSVFVCNRFSADRPIDIRTLKINVGEEWDFGIGMAACQSKSRLTGSRTLVEIRWVCGKVTQLLTN
jgi:hypothetical protein